MKFNPESSEKIPKQKFEVLPEDHWFKVAEKLHRESGEIPDPLQIRAAAIIGAFGIPSSQYSAIEKDKEGKRIIIKIDREGKEREVTKDEIIAKYLTNKAGVLIDKKAGIVSRDFRDLYLDGLPQELKEALDPDTLAIMEKEYKHLENIKNKFGNTKDENEADCAINYFRLPGGVDLFLRGYAHGKKWQGNHGEFLKKINIYPKVICMEKFSDIPFGNSLDLFWSDQKSQRGHYDVLMHQAVDAGFKGNFAEIDARDESKISMDSDLSPLFPFFPELPPDFFKKYFNFLQKEHPSLAEKIGSPKNLEKALRAQSSTMEGVSGSERGIIKNGKYYYNFPYLSKEGGVSLEPTFLEFGQQLFGDALSAVKLHLIAKLMQDGYIEKGPIIDYEGVDHLSSKSFFLQEPGYAMEVVLRMRNELMAGRVKEKGNIAEIYKSFENPDWPEIVKEIAKLVFKEVENDPSKPTAIGPNQRKLLDNPIDFLKIYNIDPKKVIPSDKKIKEIQEKFKK